MNKGNGPSEGLAWSPGQSGNSVSWDGSAVVKRYGTRLGNYYRELALLDGWQNFAVPRVLPGSRPGTLRMAYVDGISGQDAIEAGKASSVLYEMGRFLRQLQQIDPQTVARLLPGEGSTVVHGDFAPYNCLMDAEGTKLLVVLDWEAACLGDSVTDLAWCEWQFRNRFPQHGWALSKLFEGYGETPDWHLRQETVLARLEELRRDAAQAGQEEIASAWTKLIRKTEGFTGP